MKTFKIHHTNEFGTGLATKRAKTPEEALEKCRASVRKTAFSIWEDETGEEWFVDEDGNLGQ